MLVPIADLLTVAQSDDRNKVSDVRLRPLSSLLHVAVAPIHYWAVCFTLMPST